MLGSFSDFLSPILGGVPVGVAVIILCAALVLPLRFAVTASALGSRKASGDTAADIKRRQRERSSRRRAIADGEDAWRLRQRAAMKGTSARAEVASEWRKVDRDAKASKRAKSRAYGALSRLDAMFSTASDPSTWGRPSGHRRGYESDARRRYDSDGRRSYDRDGRRGYENDVDQSDGYRHSGISMVD